MQAGAAALEQNKSSERLVDGTEGWTSHSSALILLLPNTSASQSIRDRPY